VDAVSLKKKSFLAAITVGSVCAASDPQVMAA